MSWLLGLTGELIPEALRTRAAAIHGVPLHLINTPTLFISAGGLKETCLVGNCQNTPGSDPDWIVLGLGLSLEENSCHLLNSADWTKLLSAESPDPRLLNGHFVAVRWNNSTLECWTDMLGLRSLYVVQGEGWSAFSTRMDWLARLTKRTEIDFGIFGSRWITFNQISTESPIRGIQRIGPGGFAVIKGSQVSITNQRWMPVEVPGSHQQFEKTLRLFIKPAIPNGTYLSLGLSGGLDSRFLFSLLLSEQKRFSVHSFGPAEDPDVVVATILANKANIAHTNFHLPLPQSSELLAGLQEFVAQTMVTEPASSFSRLRYYKRLHTQNKIMIDGGFGEITRRQYYNRLRIMGQNVLRSRNAAGMLTYLQVRRADFFTDEVETIMKRGSIEQLSGLWDCMPSNLSEEDALDMFAIWTRFPNFGGNEQPRIDGEILNYMSFAQPTLLNYMFSLPLSSRRDGRLLRMLIKRDNRFLTNYPLVKGGTTYPFAMSSTAATVWTKIKSGFGMRAMNPSSKGLLHSLSEFILDTAHSSSVQSYTAYDYNKILKLITRYYSGRLDLAAEVEWWLTFELLRQSIDDAGK